MTEPFESSIDIRLDRSEKKSCGWFSAYQTFGLIGYLALLYAFYAGFFAALLVIALNVRKDNYMTLNSKLTGHFLSDTSTTTPWMWLKDNSL